MNSKHKQHVNTLSPLEAHVSVWQVIHQTNTAAEQWVQTGEGSEMHHRRRNMVQKRQAIVKLSDFNATAAGNHFVYSPGLKPTSGSPIHRWEQILVLGSGGFLKGGRAEEGPESEPGSLGEHRVCVLNIVFVCWTLSWIIFFLSVSRWIEVVWLIAVYSLSGHQCGTRTCNYT